jgi:hypothetical protein
LLESQLNDRTAAEVIEEVKTTFHQMPPANRVFLTLLINLLHNICLHSEVNKMSVQNVIICIVPTLKCSPHFISFAIKNYSELFGYVLELERS